MSTIIEDKDDLQIGKSWLRPWKIWLLTAIFTILLLVWGCIFFWNRDNHFGDRDYVVDHEVMGTFGDSFGGVFGPILALTGVVITCMLFIEQKKQTSLINSDQKKQSEIQRVDTLFFSLLDLHRTQKEDLMMKPLIGFGNINSCESDFFERSVEEIECNIEYNENTTYGWLVRSARKKYMQLYFANEANLSPYFRTLYRLFELIDKSKIAEEDKVRYAKIVRAQLTESELLMLRYNASGRYGLNFVDYINKYRLLKHLPVLSLFEFKPVKDLLVKGDEFYKYSLNLIFFMIWKEIYDVTVKKKKRPIIIQNIHGKGKKYQIDLDLRHTFSTGIIMTIDESKQNRDPYLKCFKDFDNEKFKGLLSNLLIEIYKFSNFQQYNEGTCMNYYKEISTEDGITTIKCYATNKCEDTLRISHPYNDDFYGI